MPDCNNWPVKEVVQQQPVFIHFTIAAESQLSCNKIISGFINATAINLSFSRKTENGGKYYYANKLLHTYSLIYFPSFSIFISLAS